MRGEEILQHRCDVDALCVYGTESKPQRQQVAAGSNEFNYINSNTSPLVLCYLISFTANPTTAVPKKHTLR